MSLAPDRRPWTKLQAILAGSGISLAVLSIAFISWGTSDVDGDGVASFAEMTDGTRPLDGDSDGDGASDGWERRHGSDPQAQDVSNDGGVIQVPCGLLQECERPAEPVPQEDAAPRVSSQNAVGMTIAMGLGAALVAGLLGLAVGRRLLR